MQYHTQKSLSYPLTIFEWEDEVDVTSYMDVDEMTCMAQHKHVTPITLRS